MTQPSRVREPGSVGGLVDSALASGIERLRKNSAGHRKEGPISPGARSCGGRVLDGLHDGGMRPEPGRRDPAQVTLEELAAAVERHRRRMAPLIAELASAALDETGRELVGVLEVGDRELGRWSEQFGQFEERTGRQEPWR